MAELLLLDASVDFEFTPPCCRICGCTDEAGCPEGCYWVEDPEGLGELCSACLFQLTGVEHG